MASNEELTRHGYDAGASGFTEMFETVFDTRPLDRALIMAFAELADGPVADIGCGSGVVTGMLHDAGVDVLGIDLSPRMVEHARRRRPDLDFRVGSMVSLDIPDNSLGGVLAWYSTIHVDDTELPTAFGEFHRVLRHNGVVLLGFQVGTGSFVADEAFGVAMHLEFRRRPPEDVLALLRAAGFAEHSTTVRVAIDERTPQAFVIVRKAGWSVLDTPAARYE